MKMIATLASVLVLGCAALAKAETPATAPSTGLQAATLAELRAKAEQGDATSQYSLGRLYHNGEGMAQDMKEAAKWYRKAAEQGNAEAQAELGYFCAGGLGVTKDAVEAVKWWEKAATQGHARAQYNLGWAHENGGGVAQDPVEAVKWYRKAAAQGHSRAQHNLGFSYLNGLGVAKDQAEAIKWFSKAAEQGNDKSQVNLAALYSGDYGVAKDENESLAWMIVAAYSGNETGIRYRSILEDRYGPQVIQSAMKRSSEIWRQIESVKAAKPDYVTPTSLQEAARRGDLAAVKNLLAKGTDVNAKDEGGAAALLWAVSRNQGPVAELLLANGADVDAASEDKTTSLHLAARYGEVDMVRILLKRRAAADAQNSAGDTPLQLAVSKGFVEIAQALVESGADVNLANQNGLTAMHYAAAKGHVAAVEFLLSKKADVNVVTKESQPPRTPLLKAAWNKHPEVVKLLVKQGAKDNWLSGVPGFDPADVGALVLSVGKDGMVQVGSLPFYLGAHTATRPWKAPAERANRSGGNILFRWDTLPRGDTSVTLIAIEDERGNRTSAKAMLPAFIGEGGIIYTDGVSSVAEDGPFAEVQIAWQKRRQAGEDPVPGGKIALSREDGKVDLVTDKEGRCKYLLSRVTGNEPITITFKSDDGKDAGQVDFDCVLRGASEGCARFVVTRMD